MISQELMLGDWVTVKKWRENPFKLTRINDNGKYYYGATVSDVQIGPFLIEEIKPIPLTQEILEKNGFVKAQMVSDTPPYDKDEEGNMHFSLNESFWGWWQQNQTFLIPANGLGWLKFKYVHELQNLLKLCKIEKTIEL